MKDVSQLLKPRYKVIADYPMSQHKVGSILTLESGDRYVGNGTKYIILNIEQYPHLFRKLAWYEERDVSEMPEFVQDLVCYKIMKPLHFFTPNGHPTKNGCTDNGLYFPYNELLPATEKDFAEYIKNSKK